MEYFTKTNINLGYTDDFYYCTQTITFSLKVKLKRKSLFIRTDSLQYVSQEICDPCFKNYTQFCHLPCIFYYHLAHVGQSVCYC